MATSQPRLAPFGRLLWKDAAQVVSLALALCGLSILLHALAALMPEGYTGFSSLAVLIPNLFALGAPALLIGQEEEAGTLRWMRTLPVDWRSLATAKLVVSVVGLMLLWIFSAVIFATAWSVAGPATSEEWRIDGYENGLAYALAFSLQLLCCGFAVSWWLRAPVPSLLTLVPVVFATTLTNNFIVGYLFRGRWDDIGWDPRSREIVLGAVGLLLLSVALTAVAYWGARRALARPAGSWWSRRTGTLHTTPGAYAYQPPSAMPVLPPGPRLALLWQHTRQTAPMTLPVFAVGVAAIIVTGASVLTEPGGQWVGLGAMIPIICAGLLGSAVFLTDNIGGRHRFLAERGIGAWRVWWTRQLLSATLTLLLSAGLMVVMTFEAGVGITGAGMVGLAAVGAYVTGQVAAQAIRRPAVAILGTPLLMSLAVTAVAVTLSYYPEFYWTPLLALPLLWLITLGLCRRWLDGRTGAGYHAQLIGCFGLAALVLVLPIAAIRWATMPAAMPQWRAATQAEAAAALRRAGAGAESWPVSFDAQLFFRTLAAPIPQTLSDAQLEEIQRLIDTVLDEGAFLWEAQWSTHHLLGQLAHRLRQEAQAPGNDRSDPRRMRKDYRRELHERLLRAMLLSVPRIRESRQLYALNYADHLEQTVADHLAQAETREVLGDATWSDLVSLLPTAEQRQQQRRFSLLSAWYQYHAADEKRYFAQFGFNEPRQTLWLEQVRTGRLIDVATRTSLDQLRSGLPRMGSSAYDERIRQWKQAVSDGDTSRIAIGAEYYVPTMFWSPEIDRQVEQLRVQAR